MEDSPSATSKKWAVVELAGRKKRHQILKSFMIYSELIRRRQLIRSRRLTESSL